MGQFDIPEPYVWDASFKVFYDNLDEEHKGLFVGIFNLVKDPSSDACKQDLYKRCHDHFVTEEGMMKAKNYKDYTSHKGIHDAFLAKLKGVEMPLSGASADWAKEWLVDHIKGTDFKYKGQL